VTPTAPEVARLARAVHTLVTEGAQMFKDDAFGTIRLRIVRGKCVKLYTATSVEYKVE
jgi:hypothetical protein